ncbi:unnamed protein product, partial [Notodromas monacha]
MLSGLVMPIYAFLYAEIFNTFTLTGEELRRSAAFWSLMFVALAVLGGIGAMIRVASQAIQNIRTVQALNRERTFFIKYINQLLEPFREAKKQAYVYGLVYSFSQGVIFLIYAGAFRLGAYLVSIEDMSPTNVYRVFFAIAFCAISVGQMNSYISEYSKAKLSAGLLIGLIKRRPEIDSYSSYGVFQPVKGKVGFRDVHFSYPQRAQVPVLQGLSATVSPGQTLAVVGPSGCGKSTVISLIQRFYDPLRGQV